MPSQFLSLRPQYSLLDFSLLTSSGGNVTTATTRNFYILGKNRSGFNLLSNSTILTINPGEKVTVTFNASIRNTGEDLHYLAVAAEDTGNPQDAKILAFWNAKEADQVSDRALPASIELINDDDFILGGSASTATALPSNPINGTIREVLDESKFYQYFQELSQWLPVATNSAYIAATDDPGGCDRLLAVVENPLFPPNVLSGADSTPIKIAYFNGYEEDNGAPKQKGSYFNLKLAVNGQTTLGGVDISTIFAGLIKIRFLGYVRRSTGELDTSIEGAGTEQIWYLSNSPIYLSQDLERGYAAAWELVLNFNASQLAGYIPNNSTISFNLLDQGILGRPSELGLIVGDAVFGDGDRLRIVPNKRLGGIAEVGGTSRSYYITPLVGEETILGLAADSANQQAAISGVLGGRITIRSPLESLLSTEALRAVISTQSGIATASAPTEAIAVASGEQLRVTVTLPVDINTASATVRSDYPDVIAGTSGALFNVPQLVPYLITGSNVYQFPPVPLSPVENITFTLPDLALATQVSQLPSNSADFNLFAYGNISAITETGGNLPDDDFQIAIAYEYPSPNYAISKISHSPARGCIPELQQTLAAVLSAYRIFITDVSSTEQLENLDIFQLSFNPVVILNKDAQTKELFAYFSEYVGNIDGETVIDTNNAPGAMIRISGGGGSGETNVNFDNILISDSGQVLVSESGNILTI